MRFIERFALVAPVLLAACSSPLPPYAPAQPPRTQAPGETPASPPSAVPAVPQARNWDEYRVQAARRILQTSGDEAFSGQLPEQLASIPVLTVQLNRDGSVRNIEVMRMPRFSPETVQMAMKAVRRAAPFGSVSHLPQPWQFNETFLYNDDLKFQIRSLVEQP